ncbi:hypothetical protein BKA93DRAFT_307200 [Sparassis latifolia]
MASARQCNAVCVQPHRICAVSGEIYGPIFRTTLAGRDATFMTSPSLIAALMRRSQQLPLYPIRGLVHTCVFKMSFDAAATPEADDQVYPVAFRPYYSKAPMGVCLQSATSPLLLASLETLIDLRYPSAGPRVS